MSRKIRLLEPSKRQRQRAGRKKESNRAKSDYRKRSRGSHPL